MDGEEPGREKAMSGGGETGRPPLRPAYLIIGDDTPKIETALRRLKKRIVEDSGTELNVDEFRASDHDAGEVVGAANTMAFLGGLRLVLVHGVGSWHKPQKQKIIDYLESPAPDACLAMIAEKMTAKEPLRRAVDRVGEVLEYKAPKPWELPEWAARQAQRLGLQMGTGETRLLVERVGADQQLILRELEKLSAYKGRGRVTADDVMVLAVRSPELTVFDLLDAVATGQSAQAFESIEELYYEGENPGGVFFRLLRHFQRLSRVVAMQEEGKPGEEIKKDLGVHPFAAKKLLKQGSSLDSGFIREALGFLAETEARMKGKGNLYPELELEMCVGRMLRSG